MELMRKTHRTMQDYEGGEVLKVDVVVLDIDRSDFKPVVNNARALAHALNVELYSADLVNAVYDEARGINNTAQVRIVVKGYVDLINQFVYLMNK